MSGFIAFYFINHFTLDYKRQYLKNSRSELKIFRERIIEFEDRCYKELKLLASHPVVKNAISLGEKGWTGLSLLEMELGASTIFIMDKTGTIIASSSDSFIGKNLGFRKYFKEAINGKSNIYFGKGITTNRVGAYFARPLTDKTGSISHVLVMKMPFENIIKSGFNALGAIMINRDGGVLLGPVEMVDNTLFDIEPERLDALRKSKIFGNAALTSLKFKRISPELLIDNKGKKYFFITLPIEQGQWFLAQLVPYKKILQKTGSLVAVYFVLLCSFVLLALKYFHNKEWIIQLDKEISLRKRAEGLQYLLTSIIEKGSEGVIITDKNGIIEYTNSAISKITGYSREELPGKNIRLFKSGIHGQDFYVTMGAQLKKGHSWHGRMTNKRKDGTFYEADVTIFPILDETNQKKYVCIQRDVTNEVQLERQLFQAQKMEAIGTLAGGVAHDFNNLLTALQGYAEIGILKLEPDAPVQKYFKQILSVCKKASQLVKQLLIFSRQEVSEKVRLNLNTTIEELFKMLNRLIGENINITLRLSPELPDINADPVNIEQILVNLVVNARDAMPGGGEITIETSVIEIDDEQAQSIPNAQSGKYVRLSIEDTGEGIPRKIVDKIFDPFFTTKGPGKGTGLGLSVVYSIVKQHGGWVNVYSELQKGTVFKIYFPIAQNTHQEPIDKAEETSKDIDGQGRIILFIEDEITVRNIGGEYLRDLNFEVLLAKDIKEAQRIYDEHRKEISVIISDLMLPDGNGFEFIKELKPKCPVIFCTGYINQLDIKTEIKNLGYHFIQKPYSEKDLVAILSTSLQL
ncbi:sensory box histidine kinase/response regulator [Dissulfuribacter thermophilus]|uniref:histidine kinase n=1 Tax=Dissulfuribacter thermophilus TaxID=1156395 RepID=A0A1B9F5D2_9BACT|nr:sensory box histidine kinase/response regulator [Dissulfuribacter thermophilus]